jgi:hypothetical protein
MGLITLARMGDLLISEVKNLYQGNSNMKQSCILTEFT